MAQIRPFRAYRPCQGMEKRIAALPYDVYNREEACEVVKKNPGGDAVWRGSRHICGLCV